MSYSRPDGRTTIQREANDLDLLLYRAISGIEHLNGLRPLSPAAFEAVEKMIDARKEVRRLMHPEDVERTQ